MQSFTPTFEHTSYQPGMWYLPVCHPNFVQTGQAEISFVTMEYSSGDKVEIINRDKYTIPCRLATDPVEADGRICPRCRCHGLVRKDVTSIKLKDLTIGSSMTVLDVARIKYECQNCGVTVVPAIDFKADNHRITKALERYVQELLERGLTNKAVAQITGVDKGIVKEIDKAMLLKEFAEQDANGNWVLKKPEHYVHHLGIDEFLLHHGHQYATIIMDLQTGHILWMAYGKKKEVVYRFMSYVGDDWMQHVKAIACDMNSDFEEAFRDTYPHIQVVFDHFHIIKNFNDMVVNPVRIAERKRLLEEGDEESAALLNGSKYILTSNRITLQEKDREALAGKVLKQGSELFGMQPQVRHGEFEARYNELLKANGLFVMMDIIKSELDRAYKQTDEESMLLILDDIVGICCGTNNEHFMKFGKLIASHIDGIVTFATLHISSGKVEGTNQMIKTTRRQAYGYHDDEYFFLKCMKNSRRKQVRV